jgi:Zn-dependent protease with chaperone function
MKFDNNTLIISYTIYQKIKLSIFFLAFVISFLMLFYLLLDFLFGFSVSYSLKGCKRYEKIKDYDFLTGIFDQVKDKFDERNVRLYIKVSNEINAFAISSLGRKAMVLTSGLINSFSQQSRDSKDFLYSLRSIMAHEMSHLVNKDFLPSFLIMANQKVTNFVSKILFIFFNIIIQALNFIPEVGIYFSQFISRLYSIIDLVLTLFNRIVVYNIYEFLRRFISRSVEFRCDFQAAKAFGGKNIALALSMLGSSGYFTIFSTHPRTKTRVKKVENVKISDAIVRPRFLDSIASYFSLLFLMIICLYFAKQAGIDLMVRAYIMDHEILYKKLSKLLQLIR